MSILVLPESRSNVDATSTRSFVPRAGVMFPTFLFCLYSLFISIYCFTPSEGHFVASHFAIVLMPLQFSLCFNAIFLCILQEHFDSTYSYKMPAHSRQI